MFCLDMAPMVKEHIPKRETHTHKHTAVCITFFHLVDMRLDLLCSVHVALDLVPVVAPLGVIFDCCWQRGEEEREVMTLDLYHAVCLRMIHRQTDL